MPKNLIGRGIELAAAEDVLYAEGAGPTALIIEGEPGIGKTALWSAIMASASQRGLATLVIRPAEGETELAFVGLVDLLLNIADDVSSTLPGPQRAAVDAALLRTEPDGRVVDYRALGMGLLTCLGRLAAQRPLIVGIDDVQWLDRPTQRVLEFALRRLRHEPVGVVVTRRLGENESDAVPWIVAAFPDERVAIQRLGPLSLAGLHRLVEERYGEAMARPALTRLEQASGGNPLLALEIVGSLRRSGRPLTLREIVPVPRDVRQLVAARTGELPPRTIALLETIAALGRPELGVLSTAMGIEDLGGALTPAVDAGLVVVDGGRVRFSHPLFGSAVYAAASPARRRRLHRALAHRTMNLEERAHHLALATATPDASVAEAVESGAARAVARGAPDAAVFLLEHARRLTPDTDPEARGRRDVALAQCLWEVGEVDRSRSLARESAARLPPGYDRAAALLLLAVQALWSEGSHAAIALCRSALDEADGDAVLQAIIHLRIAYAADDDLSVAAASTRQALALLEGSDVEAPPDLLACALLFDAEVRARAGEPLDEAAAARGRGLIPAAAFRRPIFNAWGIARERDWLLRELTDDLQGARSALTELARHDREAGLERAGPISFADLAEIECRLGDLAAASAHAAASAELAEQTGRTPYALGMARLAQASVAAHRGDHRRADSLAAAGIELAETAGAGPLLHRLRALRGSLALADGRAADAGEHFEAVSEMIEATGVRHRGVYRFRGDQIEALVLVGRIDDARDRLQELETGTRSTASPWLRAIGARCRALVASADGYLDAALAHLDEALKHHATLSMPLERGRTMLLKGQLHRRRKAKRAAADALREALSIFEQIEAGAWAARARRELARVGLRPAAPDDLTATEEEVARLAASGMTNRQVAEALVLRPKSVDGVLVRVYRKLDIHSRAELGARMGSHPAPGWSSAQKKR